MSYIFRSASGEVRVISLVPERCENCPITEADVAKHGITMTRNCKGPSYADVDAKERVEITVGGVAKIEEGPVYDTAGRVACRNAGANLWLEKQIADYQNRNQGSST